MGGTEQVDQEFVDLFARQEGERRAGEARHLRLASRDDGALIMSGRLDPTGGAAVRTALESLALPLSADDERHRERRFADALVELAMYALESGRIPRQSGDRPP